MRYIVNGKKRTESGDGFVCTISIGAPSGIRPYYNGLIDIEQLDFDSLSVGQEITVDVVPVPKDGA
jgi:hypothetical protein